MINLTALIRCKPGMADFVLEQLIAVGHSVQAHEPGTLGYRVVRSQDDPNLLITQERFESRTAMEAHNDGEGSKAFFAATTGLIEDVAIYVGEELLSA